MDWINSVSSFSAVMLGIATALVRQVAGATAGLCGLLATSINPDASERHAACV